MATNIGNLSFGIDADTKGLREVVARLNKFRDVVDRVAESQKKGADKTAAAYVRQESAIKKALQATLRLRQAQLKAGSPTAELNKTTDAIRVLTTEMTSGALKQKEFTRSMDAFSAKTGKAQRAIKDLNKAGGGKGVSNLTRNLRNLESASVLAVGPLSGLGARIRSLGAIAGRSRLLIVGLFAGITAGVVAFAKLSVAAVNAGKVFETSMARFEAASGSIEVARKEMAFVIKTSTQLGLRIDTSAKAFSRLAAATRGTSLEGEGVRKIFLAVSKAAAALRLGAGEVEGTFRAIEQIMSKGSVQAEELRGQLGERLPGAFRLAAESMGVTTAALGKMLKNGEVLADDFLPKFAIALEKAFADKALDNVNSFQGSMNLLANEALLFSQAFNEASGISRAFIFSIKKLTGAIRILREQLNNIIAALGGILAGFLFLTRSAIAAGVIRLAKAVRGLTLMVVGLNVALAANPIVALASVFTRFAVAVGVVIAVFFGLKTVLDNSTDSITDIDSALDNLKDGIPEVGVLAGKFKTLSDQIDSAAAEMLIMANVTASIARARFGADDVEGLTLRFEMLAKASKLSAKEISILTGTFMELGFGPIAADIEGVGETLFRFFGGLKVAQADLAKIVTSNDAIKGAIEEIANLELRFQALQKGQDAVDFFDDITAAVNTLGKEFAGTAVEVKLRAQIMEMLAKALLKVASAETALADTRKRAKEEEKAANTRTTKTTKAIDKAVDTIINLQRRLEEIRKGKTALELFDRITRAVDELGRSFEGSAVPVRARIRLMQELHEVLFLTAQGMDALTAAEKERARIDKEAKERAELTVKTIKETMEEIANLQLRFQALKRGRDAVEAFDTVTKAVNELGESFLKTNIPIKIRIILMKMLEAAILGMAAAETELDIAEKDREERERRANARAEQFLKLVEKSEQKIRVLTRRIKELAKGPDSFEFFTKVTEKVEAYRFALEQLSDDQVFINKLVEQYTALLEEQARLTDRFARMGQAMGSAIVKSLEDIIVVGGSVKEMLRDLGQELLRLFIRAAFLDTLQAQLGTIFRTFFFPTGAGIGAGSGSPASFPGGGPTLSHGGSFTIGGSGGKDKPVTFFGKPGEIVDVRRRDQSPIASGGSGVSIIINAPGADAGTVARIKEIVRVEMVPSIIQASTDNTIARLRRPKFA